MYTVVILEDAEKEFREAVLWYEERSEGLGSRFIDTIKSKLQTIQYFPERSAKRKYNFRQTTVKDFPFVIITRFTNGKN